MQIVQFFRDAWETWPNRLTLLRIVLAGCLVWLMFGWADVSALEMRDMPLLGGLMLGIFVVAIVLDWYDGYLARKWGQITRWGRIYDPFADKLLILGTMWAFHTLPWSQDLFPIWAVVLVTLREVGVTALRWLMESQGIDFSAVRGGKWKVVFQAAAIIAMLVFLPLELPSWWRHVVYWLMFTMVLVTVLSAIPYVGRVWGREHSLFNWR